MSSCEDSLSLSPHITPLSYSNILFEVRTVIDTYTYTYTTPVVTVGRQVCEFK